VELYFELNDNSLLPLIVGEQDHFLKIIEKHLSVTIALKGNHFLIVGDEPNITMAHDIVAKLYRKAAHGVDITHDDIKSMILMMKNPHDDHPNKNNVLHTQKKTIKPRSPVQKEYVNALLNNDLVFGIGPAGTGKTYLAVAAAVSLLTSGKVDRIILSRPAVEAGEHLGFLPGDMGEKLDPYLRPLYDALGDMLPSDQVLKKMSQGVIEIAPLAYMRGRTLSNAAIILDEAQNTTPVQMKMFLTRLGANSRMFITGDLTQIDLPKGTTSGLHEAFSLLNTIDDIIFCRFSELDIVRHPLVSRIIQAYDAKK
jgi:phosphate starvation-inducible PhoH-like protein